MTRIYIQYMVYVQINSSLYSIISAITTCQRKRANDKSKWWQPQIAKCVGKTYFLSMSRVLSDVETADTNPDLNYHEPALLLNRLETCVYILTSLNQELTLQDNQDSRTDSNDFLVLQEITTLMNQVHHYWCQKLMFV